MMPISLTRSAVLGPALILLERIGAPVERLLERAGLPMSVLTDTEGLIPRPRAARFLSQAARTEGIENLGLLSGQEAKIDRLGVFGRLICRAPTLAHALRAAICNHPTFTSGGQMWLADQGGNVQLCMAFGDRADDGRQEVDHFRLMLMVNVLRLATGVAWQPLEVQLQTAESTALRDVPLLSDTSITFGQPVTAITFPRALLRAPLRLLAAHRAAPDRDMGSWEAAAPAGDFIGSVAQVVETYSWRGQARLSQTADVLGMSVRSLQRHLAAAGSSHASLVARARFTTAMRLLEETDARVVDIALELGYSDHAHFTRAFQRWAGTSPRDFRRLSRQGPGESRDTGSPTEPRRRTMMPLTFPFFPRNGGTLDADRRQKAPGDARPVEPI